MKINALISLVLLFLLCSSSTVFAQGHNGLFGNEWIDYTPGKKYFKIKVFEDGMYRVSAGTLQSAGADINSINLNGIQLFHEGKEVPLIVESTAGTLDYVQFYGKRNTGSYDVNMYNNPDHHFNPKYSLMNDTAAYFLTWGPTASTQHYTPIGANLSSLPPKEQYFTHTNTVVYSGYWNKGLTWPIATEHLTKATFEHGEGFGSGLALTINTTVPSEHPYPAGPAAKADIRVFSPGNSPHTLEIESGGTSYATYNFNSYATANYSATLPMTAVQAGGTTISVSGTANSFDQHYVSYVDLTYPRLFNFDGNYIFHFTMPASTSRKYLELDNVDLTNSSQNQYYLYDITNNVRIHCFYDAFNSKLLTDLPASPVNRELVLINEGNPNS